MTTESDQADSVVEQLEAEVAKLERQIAVERTLRREAVVARNVYMERVDQQMRQLRSGDCLLRAAHERQDELEAMARRAQARAC